MDDLNDYYYFTQVVTHGGYAAAGRALQTPKSKLSRRVAGLEARLGVRLIERSSQRFQITELGKTFYEHCRIMLMEAENARAVVCKAKSEPEGTVRISCPTGLLDVRVGAVLPEFLKRHPRVQLHVLATNRRVDLVDEHVHIAIRSRTQLEDETETGLKIRVLGKTRQILVASPKLAEGLGKDSHIKSLMKVPTIAMADPLADWVTHKIWHFDGPSASVFSLEHEPRLVCRSVQAVLSATRNGVGVAVLLEQLCRPDLESGKLVQLWPDWKVSEETIYLVFTASRGLLPAVRALIDFLAERLGDGAIADM
ncbi:LysR substrate-binding domain-containing protein [Brenneria goodwinii]|uniref:LysR substrate-binding domain-containing protein n=1 Tax=Brenneria goodwinii TaxID=1109412 RepID=UPI0036EB8FF2